MLQDGFVRGYPQQPGDSVDGCLQTAPFISLPRAHASEFDGSRLPEIEARSGRACTPSCSPRRPPTVPAEAEEAVRLGDASPLVTVATDRIGSPVESGRPGS